MAETLRQKLARALATETDCPAYLLGIDQHARGCDMQPCEFDSDSEWCRVERMRPEERDAATVACWEKFLGMVCDESEQ